MSDLFGFTRKAVAVKFKWSDATYDYFCNFPVQIGDKLIVETKSGEATVEVVEIKNESDRATKSVLRHAEEKSL